MRHSAIRFALLSSLVGAALVASSGSAVALTGSHQTIAQAPTDSTPPPQAASGVRIVSPQASVTGDRTTNFVVQYPAGTAISVTVNGQPIDPTVRTQTQPSGDVVTQVWYGVPLKEGENVLAVQPQGGSVTSVTVTVKEIKAKLEFLPTSDPRVPADGRSTVRLEGQIVDESGAVVQQDALVTLSASAGRFVDADQDRDRSGLQIIARNGRFTAQLQSSLAPQQVRVRAAADLSERRDLKDGQIQPPDDTIQVETNGRSRPADRVQTPLGIPITGHLSTTQIEAYTQVEFITNLRAPIVSGVINLRLGNAGTDYYGSFRDFLDPDLINATRFDVTTAIFTTGRIGDWLLTGALNNQRPLNQQCDGTTRLFRDPQFCDQAYPVYGDSSTTDYLTPSIDSLYLRFERTSPVAGAGSDFFMWGDYSTPEFAAPSQFFTATSRQLHGFKGNFNVGNLRLTALFANNIQGFQRDAIAPNGTSGYYFLSQRLVVGGSENVVVETEEINRPGTVIERKQLVRGPDYELDYDRGALLFRRPIQQTEFDLFGRTLVRRIIVTYQFDGNGDGDTRLYAGRLQYNFSRAFGLESWAGVSYLNEDQGDRTFELYGVDTLIPLGKQGRIIAEYARSNNDSIFLGNVQGSAYRFEATGAVFAGVLARAYYRSVEENFANNATFSFTPGQTRYGGELAANLAAGTQLQFQYDHEENFGIASAIRTTFPDLFNPEPEPIPGSRVNNSLTTIRAGVQQKLGAATLGVEWVNRNREDRATPERLGDDSNQIVSRLSVPLTDTLTFRAQNEQNISSKSDPLYPDRT
ncbi:hypothetical protein H6F43_15035, partial [Leptolyngbya sp. FACHB-36]|nr:hypothetical protein [Leptolyngbya sp. FACHB-36]